MTSFLFAFLHERTRREKKQKPIHLPIPRFFILLALSSFSIRRLPPCDEISPLADVIKTVALLLHSSTLSRLVNSPFARGALRDDVDPSFQQREGNTALQETER
jgi:hypothetical protein